MVVFAAAAVFVAAPLAVVVVVEKAAVEGWPVAWKAADLQRDGATVVDAVNLPLAYEGNAIDSQRMRLERGVAVGHPAAATVASAVVAV